MSIIQSKCILEHHGIIGDFCNVNPGLTTGGLVKISDFCQINMSVDIINRILVEKKFNYWSRITSDEKYLQK